MKLLYQTKLGVLDNHIVIDHEEKTYNNYSYICDLEITVTQKQLRELKKLVKKYNYKKI